MVITCTFHFCLTQDVLNEPLVPNIKYICKHSFFLKDMRIKSSHSLQKQLYSYIYLHTTIYQVKEP